MREASKRDRGTTDGEKARRGASQASEYIQTRTDVPIFPTHPTPPHVPPNNQPPPLGHQNEDAPRSRKDMRYIAPSMGRRRRSTLRQSARSLMVARSGGRSFCEVVGSSIDGELTSEDDFASRDGGRASPEDSTPPNPSSFSFAVAVIEGAIMQINESTHPPHTCPGIYCPWPSRRLKLGS